MIAERLISFKTAKLAREKGFEQKIGLGIKYGLGQYYNHEGILNGDCTPYIRATIRKELDKIPMPYIIAAPTQSLVQKWLRDEHELEIDICTGYRGYAFEVMSKNHANGWLDMEASTDERYNTHEDALEGALIEALKLIK